MVKVIKANFVNKSLSYHYGMARTQLMMFSNFHAQTELIWADKNEEIQDTLDTLLENTPEERHEDIIEDYSWDLGYYQYDFPTTHRKSLTITIYNFLETELNRLCKIISNSIIGNEIRIKDIYGKGIERAFLFLSKIAKFDLSTLEPEKGFIKNVNRLRNNIVHNGGHLPEKPGDKLNKFIAKNHNLSGSPGEPVSLNSEFISEFLEVLIEFYKKLNIETERFIDKVSFSIKIP